MGGLCMRVFVIVCVRSALRVLMCPRRRKSASVFIDSSMYTYVCIRLVARTHADIHVSQTHAHHAHARAHATSTGTPAHRHEGIHAHTPLHVLYCSVPENPRVLQEAGAQQPAEAAALFPHANRVKQGLRI
jgi:hypothetical protein